MGFLMRQFAHTVKKRRQKIGLLKTNDKWSLRRGVNLSGPIVNSHSIPGSRESSQALRQQHAEDQIGGPQPSILAVALPGGVTAKTTIVAATAGISNRVQIISVPSARGVVTGADRFDR